MLNRLGVRERSELHAVGGWFGLHNVIKLHAVGFLAALGWIWVRRRRFAQRRGTSPLRVRG